MELPSWSLWAAIGTFLVASFTEMGIGAWLGAYRVDLVGKLDGGVGHSLASVLGRLRTSNYQPEAQRWVPLLKATFAVRMLSVLAFFYVFFGT